MTNEQIRTAIAGRIEASWSTCTIISRPNMKFDPPITDLPWMKYYIRSGNPFQGEIPGPSGQCVSIRTGIIMVEINVPINTGSKSLTGFADRAEHFLRHRDISGVRTGEPYSVEIGENGGYYKVMTTVPFDTWVGE
jgi:hypothetical protein